MTKTELLAENERLRVIIRRLEARAEMWRQYSRSSKPEYWGEPDPGPAVSYLDR